MHRLPRRLGWVMSVGTVAGMIDDARSLIGDLLAGDDPRMGLVRLCVLIGFGGTGLTLAFQPRWAPLPFLVLAGTVPWLPDGVNLQVVALLLLSCAAVLLDWLRLLAMVVPYLVVHALLYSQAWFEILAVLLAVGLGRVVWVVIARKEDADRENMAFVRAAAQREEAAAAEVERQRRRFEDQRRELGRELHDVVAHELTRIAMQAAAAAQGARDEQNRTAFADIADVARRGLGEMRRLMAIIDAEDLDADAPVPRPIAHVDDAVSAARAYLEDVGFQVTVD